MRLQILATVIALGFSLPLTACEWLYPSVSLGADSGSADGEKLGSGGGPGTGGSSGAGGGTSSGSPIGGSSGTTIGGSSGTTIGGSSGSVAGSSSGSGSSSGGEGGSGGVEAGSGSGASSGGSSGAASSSGGAADDAGSPAITFVQVASQDTGNGTVATVTATYPESQQAGDLNVVVVGWANPANLITAISDSAGNTYQLTTAPGSTTDAALAIYYAKSIAAASSNTVTVDLNANDYLALAILEYAGASELDQTAVSTGTGSTAATSTVVTSVAGELVFGAGEPDQKQSINFATPGAGFTKRVITSVSGMLAEDMIAPQVGSYNASGALTSAYPWVMQVATFK